MSRIRVRLTEMEMGETGTVAEIIGGHRMAGRLAAMGLIPGKKITKVSAIVLHGPVTVMVEDRTQLAIGFGMASRILIEVERADSAAGQS